MSTKKKKTCIETLSSLLAQHAEAARAIG
jgi:hypothetical protein